AFTSNSVVQFSLTNYFVAENVAGGQAVISVTRSGPATNVASVNYSTSPGSAMSGMDYTDVFGTLTFSFGETNKTFNVPINDDLLVESDETLNLSLSNPSGATLGFPSSAQ